jgi:integrase/recombinase XerC
MLRGGLTAAEVAGLKIDDVELEQRRLKVKASEGVTDSIPLDDEMVSTLGLYLRAMPHTAQGRLFVSFKGAALTGKVINYLVRKWMERAGIARYERSRGLLRRTFISHLLQKGHDLATIEKLARQRGLNPFRYLPKM